ncbi:MAG: iron ABC transporter permease [Acidobacteria bacterium]|nr:iron ABC transporter permease [Acidobacteriota bacterium]
MDKPRAVAAISAAAAIALLASVLAPLAGSSNISLEAAFQGISPHHEIFFQARLPRVLLALLTGGALAASGVLFQSLLRDALATPYTLGISSGASLGAVTAICFGWAGGVWLASFLGAVIVLVAVLALAHEGRRMSPFTLLLGGVTINSICLAAILFLQNITTFGRSLAIVRWLMGSIDQVEYSVLAALAAAILPVTAYTFLRARDWNLLAAGEEWAASRGVPVRRAMLTGYLAGSFLTGLVTAFAGPIGFVGLIVPHALRLALGADHRVLLPCSFLLGAAFLALCDAVSRTLLAPGEIPVGVITALIGGPVFICMLRRRARS